MDVSAVKIYMYIVNNKVYEMFMIEFYMKTESHVFGHVLTLEVSFSLDQNLVYMMTIDR